MRTLLLLSVLVLAAAGCGELPDVGEMAPALPTLAPGEASPPPAVEGNCDPSYPDVCIPPPPPSLNCRDIPHRRFRVLPPDPHGFDRDKDGIGCES